MRPRLLSTLLLSAAIAGSLAGCGSSDKSSNAGADTTVSAATTETTAGAATAETTPAETTPAETTPAEGSAAPAAISADCAKDKLKLVSAGKLTVGTDSPAFGPWFKDDTPSNGGGFESAVAYAIASQLGFAKDEVAWKVVKFDTSYAPGKKDFDFDINQVSITEERKASIDFSDGYYDVNQALVAFADSPAASAKSVADLKGLKLGAQQGTTSFDFIKNSIQPAAEPFVYNDNAGAKAALAAKQIDGIVLDLPTAFFVSAVEIEGSKVIGQFETTQGGQPEQFGLVFEKDNPLRGCVNEALTALKANGTLAKIQQSELSDATAAPVLK